MRGVEWPIPPQRRTVFCEGGVGGKGLEEVYGRVKDGRGAEDYCVYWRV